jgi:hypothetical protein
MKSRLLRSLFAAFALAALPFVALAKENKSADRGLRRLVSLADKEITGLNKSVTKFSDATKPGTLRVDLPGADIKIIGADVAEVTVASDMPDKDQGETDSDGFRRLDDEVTFEVTEKNNVITVALTGHDRWQGHGADFVITVPRQTGIVVDGEANHSGGDVVIEGVEGDLDISSMNGDIELRDVVGATAVNSMNGEVSAFYKAAPAKAVSLISMNGEIDLRLPADTKANLKMSTFHGNIRTDFGKDALKSKVESGGYTFFSRGRSEAGVRDAALAERDAAREAGRAVRDQAKALAESAREEAQRIREDADRVKEDANAAAEAARITAEVSRNVARNVTRNVAREVRAAVAEAPEAPDSPETPRAARAPRAPRAPHFGGKTVTGTLNGGGVDITLSSMNGTITVRQIK